MNKKYEKWSKARRFEAAVAKVLDEGWTQTEAAEIFGVSRQHLNKKVKEARHEQSERVESIKQEAIKAGPLDKQERRVGTFTEFCDTYFQNWICPDCGVHHETPGFHQDMAEAITGDYRRVVI